MRTRVSVTRVLSTTSSADSGEPPQTAVLLSSYNSDVYGCMWPPQHMHDPSLLSLPAKHLLHILNTGGCPAPAESLY